MSAAACARHQAISAAVTNWPIVAQAVSQSGKASGAALVVLNKSETNNK